MQTTSRQILLPAVLLVILAAACGSERTTAPDGAAPEWTSMRYHAGGDGAGAAFQDLRIDATGRLVLVDARGEGSSARGLLADENLETLVRLTDALPPSSYSAAEPCEGGYFLVLEGPGDDRRYASGACDSETPAAVRDLVAFLSLLAGQVREPRVQPVPFTILTAGSSSGVRSADRVIIRSRQDLVNLMARHGSGTSVAIPRVDFSRQMVIAEFLGERSNPGETIDVSGVERNELGWLTVHFRHSVPSGDCALGEGPVRPYVMFAVDRQEGNLLFDVEQVATFCP